MVVHEREEGDDEVDLQPLYIRLTPELQRRLRAMDGEPLYLEEGEGEKPVDPSLH